MIVGSFGADPAHPEVYRSGSRVMIRLSADQAGGFRTIEAQLSPGDAEEFANAVRDVVDAIVAWPSGRPELAL